MANLGALYYTLGIKFDESTLTAINKKLENAGATVKVTPELLKPIADIMPKWVNVDIMPNQVEQQKLDAAIQGKTMHAEILPLVDKLKTAVVDALKDLSVPLNGITIPPGVLSSAVTNALASANFTSVGDKAGEELAKAIQLKVDGYKYTATITAKTDKLTDTVTKALDKVFEKEKKVKLDRKDISAFRDELRKKIEEAIKVTPTLNVTQEALQRAVEGKVMRVEIVPLISKLRQAITHAFDGSTPPEIEMGVRQGKLRNLVQGVLNNQGFLINISTVNDNYSKVVQQKLNGRIYTVKIHADAHEITRSVQASLMNIQSRTFGLTVAKDILRDSINTALAQPFKIQIQVMQDQARRAVQNALNNARMVGKDDALAYQRLQTGELRAAQAELARLKAAHQSAADAARAHASASLNLGGAMGSNIRIAGELGSAMASLYSIHAAKEFLSQVIEIGGELEHQKIALETIYGSGSKMESLYGQIKSLARNSPFGVMELTKNVKQLSAYGVAYNEVYDTAKRLADISAATSVDIQRLILAFGKTKNRTFLDGLEAKQFAYANIPIYDMLSKKLTELEGKFVSVKDVMGRIKKREIGFDMVKEILWDMTDEGGKFYNMQEKLAGSVKTSWKLVRDNIELMFGEIAEGKGGGALKWLGEVLQKLTRQWETIGSVVLAAAGVFGVYKMAVMATNVIMGHAHAANMRQKLSQAQLNARVAQSAMLYRGLSAEESRSVVVKSALGKVMSKNILKTNALTSSELKALVASKSLTRDSAARLIALGKITPMQARYLINQKLITIGDLRAAVSARKHGVSLNILGKEVKVASFRFRLLASSIWSSVKAMGAFIFNPATLGMAAIGGAVALWQKNSQEMEKAKEIGDSIFNKAVDGADNLKQTIKELKPSQDLSPLELTQGIEKMEQAIKDYSPTPINDINDALYTQDGLLRPLAERYDELKKKLEGLKETFDAIADKDIGSAVQNAIDASNGVLFDDDVNTDAQDYDSMLKKREQAITKYVAQYGREVKRAVDEAARTDEGYAKAIEGMKTYGQKFAELLRNQQNYARGFYAASKKVQHSLSDIFDVSKLQGSWNELRDELGTVWDSLNADAKIKGLIGDRQTIKDATEETKEAYAISIRDWINGLEVSDEVKQKMFNFYSDLLKFDFAAVNAQGMMVDALNKGLEVEVGKEIFEKVRNGLKLTPEEQEKFDRAFYKIYKQLYDRLPEIERKALNEATGDNSQLTKEKMVKIQAQMNVRADWQEWQREIDDATGNLKPIQTWVKGASDIPSFVKAVKEGYKTAKTTLDELKPLMLKAGIKFELGKELPEGTPSTWFMGLSDTNKEYVRQYNSVVREMKAAQKASETLGFSLDDKKKGSKSGSKGSQKDPFADAIKERIKILKEAKKEYDDLAKLIGRDAAADKLKDSPIFEGLKANKFLPEQSIPKTIEEYKKALNELQEKLTAKGLKTQKHRELNVEIEKVKFEIDKKETENALKLALDKVSKEAERQIADWNLFDKIRKATGNKDFAMSIAFGMNADAETDYPALVKKQFNEAYKEIQKINPRLPDFTYDNLTLEKAKKLGDDVVKIYEDAEKKLEQYARQQKDSIDSIISEYQSLSEKLAKIDEDRKDKIDIVNKSSMPKPQKAALRQRINVEADYQKFQQSADYLKFFSGIYSLTMDQAQQIGDKIRLHLDQRLQAGKISAEEYYKEIERINQQLTKLRKVKSDAMTFMTGGLKGLNDKKLETSNSNVLAQMTKLEEAEEELQKARAAGNEEDIKAAQLKVEESKKELEVQTAIRDAIIKNMEAWENALGVMNVIANIAKGMSEAFNTLRDMADSFGFDTDSNAWNTMEAVMDTLTTVTEGTQKIVQSLMNGDIGGTISGVFSTLLTPITIWNKLHDKKLQKDIENSQKRYGAYDRLLSKIERRLGYHLGGYNDFDPEPGTNYGKDGAFGYERDLKKKQLEELKRQQADMEAMKKKDQDAINELKSQISELEDEIAELQIEAANAIYGIDIASWAETISDALWDAFMKGEDALEAFDKAVASIMSDVVKNILKVNVLERAFQNVRDWLGSEDGPMSDGILNMGEAAELWRKMQDSAKKGMDNWNAAMDAMPEDMMQFLKDNYDKDSKSGMTAGLQSLTEDTGDLLVSYVNGMRGDLSVIRADWEELIQSAFPQMNIIAEAQLQAQRQIAENTLRTAIAAELINKAMGVVTSNQDRLERSWRRIAERNWGGY